MRAEPNLPREAPTVVYLPDCFSVYNEPRIGQAAIAVLEHLGYHVALPRMGCCGRPHLSGGMLAEAQQVCSSAADALGTGIESLDPAAIVTSEPSCLSAIADDWPDLKMDVPIEAIHQIADRSMLIEQFIDARWDTHPIPPTPIESELAEPVLLHAHCHQKALWGADSSADLLRRFCGDQLTVLDTGCCGMAGFFGMTRDHYDLAMQIGELSLLPAVREHPEATVLAPGTSCRHQLLDGAKRHARHPIEFIAEALGVQVSA